MSGSSGGRAIMAARSSSMRSDGRQRSPEWTRTLALRLQPVAQLGVEVVTVGEASARA